jgi:hypothetical protein
MGEMMNETNRFLGLNGRIEDVQVAVPVRNGPPPRQMDAHESEDIDLKRMAEWALHYLVNTPREKFDFEPVFQCHPLRCPPVPEGHDVVVPCDTDARMEWEWYYMRDITGSEIGRDVEAGFHKRMRKYIDDQGVVWSHVGCYNEGDIDAEYGEADKIIHIWGATKILKSLSEDYLRTKDPESKALARKVMLAFKRIAKWNDAGLCWFAGGMGALQADGTPVGNGWNQHPAPIVGPLLAYWRATGDEEGLAFAKAYADGILAVVQPGGLVINPDGSFKGHSHGTMHTMWGLAELSLATGDRKYMDVAKKVWDFMLTRGTGTGWFPAGPDTCNETCCVSDMISTAAAIAQSGHPEYFDFVERFVRNYISNLQFIVTPDFEKYYRGLHADKDPKTVEEGLEQLRRFQGGIIGGSGLNDFENVLLGGVSGFEMFGCCAPEGMRAIYTAWQNTISRNPASALGPAGVYVNLGFQRDSEWGTVVSHFPAAGGLTVRAKVRDAFFLRIPSWADRSGLKAFLGGAAVKPVVQGDYLHFDAVPGDEMTVVYPLVSFTQRVSGLWKSCAPNLEMKFHWLGNMVVSVEPAPTLTPLFTGKPKRLPPYPAHVKGKANR